MPIREQWDGGEWQQHCCNLLGMRYGENIQFIPDRTKGDGGLEAYRLDDTVVYQCYAPKDAYSPSTQTDALKRKIRTDTKKLVDNPKDTAALLGVGYLVRRWVLITPECDDKEIVKYAREKSREIVEEPRPIWCHETFQIVVCTDRQLFPAEISTLYREAPGKIRLIVDEPTPAQVESFIEASIADTLTEKLLINPSFAADEQYLADYRTETLLDYVYGKIQLAVLQDTYPLAYEAIGRRAQATYRRLNRRLYPGSNSADLEALTQELSDGFAKDVPSLDSITCDQLAQHYIATWWISCPLRFRAIA